MASLKHIKEYIQREDGTEGTLLIPKLILGTVIDEATKALLPRELAALRLGPAQIQGAAIDVNLETPNTLKVKQVAEGAEIPLDAVGFTTVQFRPIKYGVAIRITREMMEDAQFPLLERNIRAAGRRFAEKETERILNVLDGAGNTTTGGAAITIADIVESMFDLEDNDFEPTDLIVGNEVVQDVRQIDTFVEANKSGSREMLTTGFIGNIYGMNVIRFSSNAVPDTTNSKKRAYVIDRGQAYGIAIKRDLTVENFDLPSYDMQGVALTWRFDTQLLRTLAVSRITTT